MQYFSICNPVKSTFPKLTGKRKMYYIIKLYYFVAVLSLTYTPICKHF